MLLNVLRYRVESCSDESFSFVFIRFAAAAAVTVVTEFLFFFLTSIGAFAVEFNLLGCISLNSCTNPFLLDAAEDDAPLDPIRPPPLPSMPPFPPASP